MSTHISELIKFKILCMQIQCWILLHWVMHTLFFEIIFSKSFQYKCNWYVCVHKHQVKGSLSSRPVGGAVTLPQKHSTNREDVEQQTQEEEDEEEEHMNGATKEMRNTWHSAAYQHNSGVVGGVCGWAMMSSLQERCVCVGHTQMCQAQVCSLCDPIHSKMQVHV